jgi:nitrate reductase gamma subunit
MTTTSATAIAPTLADRVGLWLAGAVAATLLLAGLAGYLSSGWGFALLLFAGLSLCLALALFGVLVFSHRGDTDRLVKSSKASFVVGAAAYAAAVCALAGYYGYETFKGRMELRWIIFGPFVVWALISFDFGIYGKLIRKNLPTWHRFKRFIKREDSDPVAMRRTAWNDIIVQRSLFRTSKLRWLRHALIFWGFTAMFATELAAVVVRDAFPAFGWHDVWREPGHPVRLAFDLGFDVTGLMVLIGCVIALGWRVSVRGKPERKFADSPMSAFLLFIVLSGFVVEGWRIAQTPTDPIHAWSFVGLGFARIMATFGTLPASAYQPLWLVHVIAACALIGYLPATRLVHTCATPIGRLMNSQKGLLAARKIGVLGAMMSRHGILRSQAAPTLARRPSVE